MNRLLHSERIHRGTHRRRYHDLAWRDVPEGAFVLTEDGVPALVVDRHLTEWTREGYRRRRALPPAGTATVITPPATLAALRAGCPVQIDETAR